MSPNSSSSSSHQQIPFKIVHFSSEMPQNRAHNLEIKNKDGWASQEFANPPHELTFQFPGLTRIKQLKILSHSYKIAKKIELYIGNLPNSIKEIAQKNEKTDDLLTLINVQRASFKRIGYMSLEDNSRTQWKAWELKTANLDVTCTFIKFKMREHHKNEKNLYNQVALIGVEFFGVVKEKFPEKILPPVVLNKNTPGMKLSDMRPSAKRNDSDDINEDAFDGETKRQLEKLNLLKQRAREEENFKEAHDLKSKITGLKRTAHQLNILEQQKNDAADNEDYLLAEELKTKILELRRVKEDYARAAQERDIPKQRRRGIDERRDNRLARRPSPSGQDSFDDTPVVTRRKVARQISIDEDEAYPSQPDQKQSYESEALSPDMKRGHRGMRRSYASNRSEEFDDEENIPFHQPTRRQIDSVQLSSTSPTHMTPSRNDMTLNEDEYEDLEEQQSRRTLPPVDDSYSQPHHIQHHEDSPVQPIGMHGRRGSHRPHDEQPIRPAKDDRYDFESHAGAYESNAPDQANEPQVQQIGGPIQEELIAELESWEANMVAAIIQKKDSEPTKLLPGVDDLQAYINVFGEFVARSLLSVERVHRELALRAVIDHMKEIPVDKQQLLSVVCQYMKRGLKDVIPHVYFLSIELLQKAIAYCSDGVRKAAVHHAVAPVVPILVRMLGETNARKKNDAQQTLIMMADEQNIEPSLLVKYLMKEDKIQKNWRPLHGRLQLLGEMIRNYGFTEKSGLNEQTVMRFIQKNYEHSRREVRTAAVVATMEVYLVIKESIPNQDDPANWFVQKYLPTDMREALRKEIIDKLMAENLEEMRDDSIIHPPAPKRRNTKLDLSQNDLDNESLSEARSPAARRNINEVPEHEDVDQDAEDEEGQAIIVKNEDGSLSCTLCGNTIDADSSSSIEDVFDHHIIDECPILQKCPMCGCMEEVFSMNAHQLEKCDARDQVKQCPRCKMAIRKEEYEEHVSSRSCPKAGARTQICPLCGEEIGPGSSAWKVHLVDDGCPANPKSFKG